MVSRLQISHDECGVRDPRNDAKGRHVGNHRHVVVTLFPGREFVAGDRVVLDIDGEQIVAAFCAVFDGILDEETGRHSLPDESTLDVGERDDDRVDVATLHEGAEFGDRQKSSLLGHGVIPLR